MGSANLKRNILRIFLVISLIASTIAVAAVGTASSMPVISVEPKDNTAGVGETFTVDITVADISEEESLYYWDVWTSFDPDILECTNYSEGPFLSDVDRTYWDTFNDPPKIDNYEGLVRPGNGLRGWPTQGAVGSGVLCNITFRVKAVGRTTLHFYMHELFTFNGTDLNPIEHEDPIDGFFTNVHDIAITNVTASPNSVAVGEPVYINVTVTNEGDFSETFDVTTYWKIGVLYDVIETRKDIGLQNETSGTLPFTWTPIASGNYTIIANATVLQSIHNPQGIDNDPTDNTFPDGEVEVTSPTAPVATFTASSVTPLQHEVVTFNASASYDPDGGNITSYEWNFGDGTPVVTETNPITNHTYMEPGEYLVVLTVTDDEEEKGISQPQLIKVMGYPVAFFTYSPEFPLKNWPVTFNASLSDPKGGTIDSYAWDFGDGTTKIYVKDVNLTDTTTHTYTDAGTYPVTLTITDSEDLTDSFTDTLNVTTKHDVAVLSVSYKPSKVYAGQWIGIDIKVKNQGTETETFNVTAYLDDTPIETREVIDLAPLKEKTLDPINWKTTGLSAGNYTIKAVASTVPNETDTADNKANVTMEVHVADLAITNVTASPITVLTGDKLNVSVTVKNEGTVTPDVASIVHIYLTNATHPNMTIMEFSIGELASGTEKTNWKTWDITRVTAVRISPGTYTLSAYVSPIEGAGGKEIESDFADNTYTYGNVTVGASLISISANPQNITVGSSTTINGSITPVRSSVNVTIKYRLSGDETWNTLETVTTDENRTYSYDWTPQTAGTYEIKASWEGDNNTLPSESKTLIITVSPAPPNVFLYVVAAVAIIVMAATAIYLLRFRKPKPA